MGRGQVPHRHSRSLVDNSPGRIRAPAPVAVRVRQSRNNSCRRTGTTSRWGLDARRSDADSPEDINSSGQGLARPTASTVRFHPPGPIAGSYLLRKAVSHGDLRAGRPVRFGPAEEMPPVQMFNVRLVARFFGTRPPTASKKPRKHSTCRLKNQCCCTV